MRIFVTGGTGQVGSALSRLSWPSGVELVAPGRAEVDLSDADGLKAYTLNGGFAAVINAGAYTAVDRAESDSLTAWKVNALAPAALAEATKQMDIPLVHVSTDYVFDGSYPNAYPEDHPTHPLGVYGASKEAGEQAVRTGNPLHVILRTAWVFSADGGNFVKTMLRLGRDRPLLRVVDDQRGCPTSAADIAEALAAITLRLIDNAAAPPGTYHFVNEGAVSWCGLAREIFRQQSEHGDTVPKIEAIGTKDYPTPAARPANSVLSTVKFTHDYAITPRPWQAALSETLAALRAAG